jgi:hypothetical protein
VVKALCLGTLKGNLNPAVGNRAGYVHLFIFASNLIN